MQIKLDKMIFQNFMGFDDFTFEPEGANASIMGENGKGKTTIFSGWTFLLFDKDPQGKADFNIKPIRNNEVQHNIESSVEAHIRIDDKSMILKKIYKETYTKKRGSNTESFTGHETIHYIDGLKVQKKEWEKRLSGYFDFEKMRILSMAGYFTSDDFGKGLKPAKPAWKWRRDILFSLDENMPTDEDIMDDEIKGILDGKPYEDYQAMVKQQQANINSDIKGIPPRVDEQNRNIKAVKDLKREAIESNIKQLETQIQGIKDKNTTTALRKKIADLEADLQQAKNELQKAMDAREKDINDELKAVSKELDKLDTEADSILTKMKDKEADIKRYNKQRNGLAEEWHSESIKEYNDIESSLCPECGYNLNEKQNNVAKSEFATKKAKKLHDIEEEGYEIKDKIVKAGQDFEELEKKRNEALKKYNELGEKQVAIRKRKEIISTDITPEIKQAMNKVDDINGKINTVIFEMENALDSDTSELENQVAEERKKLAQLDASEGAKVRIEELKADEKRLTKEYERLEYENSLIEQFIKKKVSLTEETINSKFEFVEWKLFEIQINEGLKELCAATYKGVEYDKGSSGGEGILVNVDIIKALQKHWDMNVPLFIDEWNRCTFDIDTNCQTFYLSAQRGLDELQIEYVEI